MRGTHIVLGLLAMLPVFGGCATAGSLGGKDGSKVYGGTRLDAAMISESLSPSSTLAQEPGIEHSVLLWHACCGLADLPLSAAADTLLLPVTVPLALNPSAPVQEPAPRDEPIQVPGAR